jgi:hypothetical protein
MKNYLNKNTIFFIIGLSFIIKIICFFYFSDDVLKNEWEILIHNFKISGILGFNVVVNDFYAIPKLALPSEVVLPSVFMPPLYSYFLIIHDILFFDYNFINFVIFSQIVLSLVAIYFFYKTLIILINLKSSLILTFIFAFFPLYVYSIIKISSISLQICLLVLFFYFVFKYNNKPKIKNLIIFSIISGLLVLIRGEFLLFYLLTNLYFFIFNDKKIYSIAISLIICSLIISPYLKRNYDHFETITLTKSFGYNLLKGNNPELKIEGNLFFIENEYKKEELKIFTDHNYEINLDNFYKEEAIKFISQDPQKYIKFYFLKIISFIFFDYSSTYPNYFNILHIVPKIILSLLSLIGAIIALRSRSFFQYLSFFYFGNIFLFSIFFILPRYSLILLPIQLFLCIPAINKLISKLRH